MASASVLFSTLFIPISCEKTNATISSRIRCCEDTLGNPNLKLIDASNGKGMDRFPEKLSVARVGSCPRLRRIILVRHGQSEGNVDESVYTMVSDPKIRLIRKGWHEAEGCEKMVRDMIESDGMDDWKVYFVFWNRQYDILYDYTVLSFNTSYPNIDPYKVLYTMPTNTSNPNIDQYMLDLDVF